MLNRLFSKPKEKKVFLDSDYLRLHKDAFSHGQMMSKIWLCDELICVLSGQKIKINSIDLYGGWYGLLALMMKQRPEFRDVHFCSFDLDQLACEIATKINDAFVYENQSFISQQQNVNELSLDNRHVDLVINTSCEHIVDNTWFECLPVGQLCLLQSNNMVHEQHTNTVETLEEMKRKYRLSDLYYSGEKFIDYGTFSFSRFMMIGRR